jgi:hypothetical protein
MVETSQVTLTTAKAANYAAQLAKHFGHKIKVEDQDGLTVFHFTAGRATAKAAPTDLTLTVQADTVEKRARVQEILGSHLERFAFREDLRVIWPDQITQEASQ